MLRKIILIFVLMITILIHPHSDEYLRIKGMGGVCSALIYPDCAVSGNPACLVSTKKNNISIFFDVGNLSYEMPEKEEDIQFVASNSATLGSGFAFSTSIRNFGLALGYQAKFDNNGSSVKVKRSTAEYVVDERKFSSKTELILDYDIFYQSLRILSLGYQINDKTSIGLKLRYCSQTFKKGVLTRPFQITAVHEEDINRNDATKLIPAIINNIDIAKAVKEFKSGELDERKVVSDQSRKGLSTDIGLLVDLRDDLSFGLMLENLTQQRFVKEEHSKARIGVSFQPFNSFTVAVDCINKMADANIDFNMGFEIQFAWRRFFEGGIAIRGGFSHEDQKNRLSSGICLKLGGSQLSCAIIKDRAKTGKSATYLFSSGAIF